MMFVKCEILDSANMFILLLPQTFLPFLQGGGAHTPMHYIVYCALSGGSDWDINGNKCWNSSSFGL